MYWASPRRKTDPLGALVVTAASGLLLFLIFLLYDFVVRPLWKKAMGNKNIQQLLAKAGRHSVVQAWNQQAAAMSAVAATVCAVGGAVVRAGLFTRGDVVVDDRMKIHRKLAH